MLDRSPTAASASITDALPLLWFGFVEALPWLLVAGVVACLVWFIKGMIMLSNVVIIQKVEVRLPSGHVEQLTTSQLAGLYRDLDAWLKRNAANLDVAWEGQKLSVLCSICSNPKCDNPNGKH